MVATTRSMEQMIMNELKEAQTVLTSFISNPSNIVLIEEASTTMARALKNGHKIISCGNGGSHCDAMHFAEELTGRYRHNRVPLPAIAISDPSYLSCVANDFGYEQVFSRFTQALGNAGDVLLAISTSGQSDSVLNAILIARQKKMMVVLLTGNDGGKMKGLANVEICIQHTGYADRIQEMHIKIIHMIILLMEEQLKDLNAPDEE